MEAATGVPEALALGMMYSSIVFHRTKFGAATGLEFRERSLGDALKDAIPMVRFSKEDREHRDTCGVSGAVVYAISHDARLRMTLSVSGSDMGANNAYVIVAGP